MNHRPEPTEQPAIDNRAVRRNLGLLLGLFGAIVVIGAVGGLLLARHAGTAHRTAAHRHSPGGLVATLLINVPIVVALPVVLWLVFRRPAWRAVMQYGWRRRNRVGKALRRGRPIAEADLPVAAAMAALAQKQRWLPAVYGVLTLLWLFNGLTAHGFRRWNGFFLAGLYVLLTPYLVWLRRRTVANYQRAVAIGPPAPPRPSGPNRLSRP